MKTRNYILGVIVLAFGAVGYAGESKDAEVITQINKEFNENYYLLATQNCKILLRLNKRSDNSPIKDMSQCPSTLERRMQLTEKVLAKVAQDTNNLTSVKRYSFGGIDDCAELMYRLAAAAAMSPEWDRKTGRPKGKGKEIGTNKLIEKLINENNIFGELTEILAKYHLKLKVYSVENPLIFKVKKSPIAEYVQKPNSRIYPDDELPMSASIVLAIGPQ